MFIALFIALTGVGAGTVTVPVLVLFLGVPAPIAVGIGLMFSSAIKLILVPAQISRRNVAWRTLGFMLLGGVPGRAHRLAVPEASGQCRLQNLLNAILGAILVDRQVANRLFLPSHEGRTRGTGPQLPASVADAAGGRRGRVFFGRSRRAGQRRTAQSYHSLPAQVVGTDIAFGFVVSLIGSGAHWFSNASNPELLMHLIAGGIVGAISGTLLSTRVPRRQLRFALWVWLLILGGQFSSTAMRHGQPPIS